jgi:hypothetical protein
MSRSNRRRAVAASRQVSALSANLRQS